MKKTNIEKIRIDILSNQESALSILLDREGSLYRQGNAGLPVDTASVTGLIDTSVFKSLLDNLDEHVFPHAGVYDHPHKPGTPLTYSIAFLDQQHNTSVFEFRLGSETNDVGELLPYFDGFIAKAVELTNAWYTEEKTRMSSASV